MIQSQAKKNSIILFLFAVISFIYVAPLVATWGDWIIGHEHARYPLLLQDFVDLFKQGVLYPRWISTLIGGYGLPTFVFYQPGFFYFSLPFVLILQNDVFACYASLFFAILIGLLGAYKLARFFNNDEVKSFCLAVIFIASPYLYANFYYRGDLSEFYAILFLPVAFYYYFKCTEQICSRVLHTDVVIKLVLTTCFLAIMHPAVIGLFAVVIIFFALYDFILCKNKKKFFVVYFLCLLVSLALTSSYWMPIFSYIDLINYEKALRLYYRFKNPVGTSTQDIREIIFGQYLVGIGAVHFAMAVFCAACSYKNKRALFLLLVYALTILLIHHSSNFVWNSGVLDFIQFPFRIQSIVTILQFIIIAIFLGKIVKRKEAFVFLMLFAVLVKVYIYTNPYEDPSFSRLGFKLAQHELSGNRMTYDKDNNKKFFTTLSAEDEIVPKLADLKLLHNRYSRNTPIIEKLEIEGDNVQVINNTKHESFIEALVINKKPAGGARVRINQIFFPGWNVYINGIIIPTDSLKKKGDCSYSETASLCIDEAGRMLLELSEPKDHLITAHYNLHFFDVARDLYQKFN